MKLKKWEPGRVWYKPDHRGWGDRISWENFEELKLNGHTTPVMKVDDEIREMMESKRIARFRVKSVKRGFGVIDLWWATVEFMGYTDEVSPEKLPPVSKRSIFSAA